MRFRIGTRPSNRYLGRHTATFPHTSATTKIIISRCAAAAGLWQPCIILRVKPPIHPRAPVRPAPPEQHNPFFSWHSKGIRAVRSAASPNSASRSCNGNNAYPAGIAAADESAAGIKAHPCPGISAFRNMRAPPLPAKAGSRAIRPYSGMLSCFFHGLLNFFPRSDANARQTRRRVFRGIMTSSMNPFSAATKGLANRSS